MKRILSFLVAATMLLSLLPLDAVTVFAANNAKAVINIESVSAALDTYVDVAINISENPGIASMGLTLSFDKDLTLVGATNGEAFAELTMTPPAQLKKQGSVVGSCRFAWLGSDNCTEVGTILNLRFQVSADATLYKDCHVSISCDDGDILDNARNPIELTANNGKVTIIDYIPGDVDRNGYINMLDVLTLCQYYVDGCKYDPDGYAVNIKAESGDVDANGKINMLDILTICQYYVDGCKYDPNGYGVKLLPGKRACNHSIQHFDAKSVTCTEDGNIEYWHCDLCNNYFGDADGKDIITYDYTVIQAKGHTVVVDEAVPATESTPGLTEGFHCSECHEVLTPQKKIKPLKPNTKSIKYHIVNKAKHPYLATLEIDTSSLQYSYIPGQALTLKNIDLGKYGYTFDGWYDGFGDTATQIKEISATNDEDIELYAHITETVYDITYNMYQIPVSSSPDYDQLHYTVSKGNENLYSPEINNYIFLGWYDNSGVEYKTIPTGTTGHITLNAYYTSLRNYAVSVEDNNPIILEDQNTNVVYFTYELGEIRNIPLNGDKPFWEIQSVAGLSQQVSDTYTTSISTEEADTVSKIISDMTTNSSTWTLSESWNNVTTVNESWAESIGKTTEQSRTDATTSSNTLSLSAQNGGSSYHKTEDGKTVYDYDSKTVTKDKGHQFDASINANYTNKMEANLGASTEYGATDSYGYTKQTKKTNTTESSSQSDKDTLSAGIKYENGVEVNAGVSYGYHNNTNTVTKTGTDKVTTNSKIDENTSSWNNSATFSATQQHSSSQTVRNTLSDIVTTTKGYGNSYSNGGTDTSSQGFSTTASNTSGTTSSVTYSKLESKITTTTYGVDGRIEGKYRSILVGKAHVFAVVGYDYATKSYFTYTFSVMDDEVKEFLDYTPKGGDFTDCEYSCLPFEVPYYVFEYVTEKTSKTTGVQYITNSKNGTARITGYTGTDSDIIIPSYVSDGKQVYKVTEISSTAFAGKSIRSVVLGEFIKSIPDGAFKNCTELEEVIGSFTKIGNEAFAGCTNLTNMNIPSNVIKIGTNAFIGANSIKVRAINSLSAYAEAQNTLPNGTDEQIVAKQKEITQEYIQSILDSGAQNIVLDLSYVADGTPLSLNVPKIASIEINGGEKTYNNFYIVSDANETSLSEMTIISNQGTSIKVSSAKLTLHKVFVSGKTTALILEKDGAILSLIQDSVIETKSNYAVISKNPIIESQITKDGAAGCLSVIGNLGYVNSITGEDYVDVTNGEFIKISEEEFEKYIIGIFIITFDANGGNTDIDNKQVMWGSEINDLPTPTRENCTFDGWFTENGTQITADALFTELNDITVKAHWTSGWVLADALPEDANVASEKWTYDLTTNITSDKSSVEGYTLYNTTSEWGDYGSWSSWSKSTVSGSDSRQAETKTVTDRAGYTNYRYWVYRTSDGWGYGTQNYNTGSHGYCTIYDEINLSYSLPVHNSSLGTYGPYDSSKFSHSGDSYWFFGESKWVPAVTHTEYRYRERSLIYTYYHTKTEAMESNTAIAESDTIRNVQKWVQYTVK